MHKAEKVTHEPYEVILKTALADFEKVSNIYNRILNIHHCVGTVVEEGAAC